jgi:hypothetical protein
MLNKPVSEIVIEKDAAKSCLKTYRIVGLYE